MFQYTETKPRVYIETTVVSYLVARPSNDPTTASRQQMTRQLWNEYSDNFEFVVSDVVINEILEGDTIAARQRYEAVANLTALNVSPAADALAQDLIDAGAVPSNLLQDAQHISIATVQGVDYLVTWNFKHIVNKTKRHHINQVCRSAGFQPIILCTPVNLIEGMQMKEQHDEHIDAVLEECYRMKEAFAARFDSMAELTAYLKESQKRERARGRKYIDAPLSSAEFPKKIG